MLFGFVKIAYHNALLEVLDLELLLAFRIGAVLIVNTAADVFLRAY